MSTAVPVLAWVTPLASRTSSSEPAVDRRLHPAGHWSSKRGVVEGQLAFNSTARSPSRTRSPWKASSVHAVVAESRRPDEQAQTVTARTTAATRLDRRACRWESMRLSCRLRTVDGIGRSPRCSASVTTPRMPTTNGTRGGSLKIGYPRLRQARRAPASPKAMTKIPAGMINRLNSRISVASFRRSSGRYVGAFARRKSAADITTKPSAAVNAPWRHVMVSRPLSHRPRTRSTNRRIERSPYLRFAGDLGGAFGLASTAEADDGAVIVEIRDPDDEEPGQIRDEPK